MSTRGDNYAATFDIVRAVLRSLVPARARKRIRLEASMLDDLEMDSLKVAELTLALEESLGRPVFLPEWVAGAEDPAELTVGSLVKYLAREG